MFLSVRIDVHWRTLSPYYNITARKMGIKCCTPPSAGSITTTYTHIIGRHYNVIAALLPAQITLSIYEAAIFVPPVSSGNIGNAEWMAWPSRLRTADAFANNSQLVNTTDCEIVVGGEHMLALLIGTSNVNWSLRTWPVAIKGRGRWREPMLQGDWLTDPTAAAGPPQHVQDLRHQSCPVTLSYLVHPSRLHGGLCW